MGWKWLRAVGIVCAPLVVIIGLLEVRLANGMVPWDVRLSFAVAVMLGIWMGAAWRQFAPQPEPVKQPEPQQQDPVAAVLRDMIERGASGISLTPGMVIGPDHDECGCGNPHRHELIVVPLPSGECLVSHRDSEDCKWVARVPDRDAVGPAVTHHMEFDCALRSADT